jgi:hypothetical protein
MVILNIVRLETSRNESEGTGLFNTLVWGLNASRKARYSYSNQDTFI